MNQLETVAAPTLPFPPEDKWRREQQAFRRLLPELLTTHRGRFVAVHEGQVVENGEDKLAVAAQAYARFGYLPIYVGLVTEQRVRPLRIASPRLLPPERPG